MARPPALRDREIAGRGVGQNLVRGLVDQVERRTARVALLHTRHRVDFSTGVDRSISRNNSPDAGILIP